MPIRRAAMAILEKKLDFVGALMEYDRASVQLTAL